ncbi:MAG: DUF4395 domain-containing protein [Acidimicrobiia bacterium]|nr:DUF4395 domain-containing protein [Acidimicrobiia bacterium]
MSNKSLARTLFSFPNPVNEHSARMVAVGAVCLGLTYIITGNIWILALLTYGFWARALTGPTLSPLGQVVTRVLSPLLAKKFKPKFCSGPPKRFAQSIGAFFTTSALFTYVLGDSVLVSKYFISVLLFAASCEAFFGFCFGCAIFGYLMKWGIIPEEVCEKCQNYKVSDLSI